MAFLKNKLAILVTFVAGMIIVVQYYLNIPALKGASSELLRWNVVLAAFALVLGIGGIVRMHLGKIMRWSSESIYSIICLATLAVFLVVGITKTTQSANFNWLYDYILLPLQSTTYATTVFFVTSAAYRAFRVKNSYGVVLMVSAILIMLKVGLFAAIMPVTPKIAAWVWDIPNTAGMRAVVIGSALSLVGNSFRVIIGLERGHLGGGE